MNNFARIALHLLVVPACLLIATTTQALTPRNVSFLNQQGITITGKLYRPAGTGPWPAIVMLHGCSGIYSNSDPAKGVASIYREWAERLVWAGYVALLVDSFTPRSAEQNQCGNGSAGVSEVLERPYDALAAWAYLRKRGAIVDRTRIGLLGWSHGASTALTTIDTTVSLQRRFRAAVAFYPGCGLYGAFGGISESSWSPVTPLRILHGGIDPLYTAGYCQTRVERAALSGGAPVRLTVYAGAQHSFDQATSVSGKWTQADVTAKTAADAATMQFFANKLLGN